MHLGLHPNEYSEWVVCGYDHLLTVDAWLMLGVQGRAQTSIVESALHTLPPPQPGQNARTSIHISPQAQPHWRQIWRASSIHPLTR